MKAILAGWRKQDMEAAKAANPTKTKVISRKKRNDSIQKSNPAMKTQPRPTFLQQTLYFINDQSIKFISIGYSPENDFKPTFILANSSSYVILSVTDWLSLFMMKQEIEKCFAAEKSDKESVLYAMKNITVSKYPFGYHDSTVLLIENTPKTRLNNQVFINLREYSKLLELEPIFQSLLKQMQPNAAPIDDYYNMYAFYCIQKQKQFLSDDEYFLPIISINNVDSFKLFQEIPVICSEKLKKDIQFPQMTSC